MAEVGTLYYYIWPISFTTSCCGALGGNGNGTGDGNHVTVNLYHMTVYQVAISTYNVNNTDSSLNVVTYNAGIRCQGIAIGY